MNGEFARTDQRRVVRQRHLGDVELLELQHAPEDLGRLHRQIVELDSLGPDNSFAQGRGAVIGSAGKRQSHGVGRPSRCRPHAVVRARRCQAIHRCAYNGQALRAKCAACVLAAVRRLGLGSPAKADPGAAVCQPSSVAPRLLSLRSSRSTLLRSRRTSRNGSCASSSHFRPAVRSTSPAGCWRRSSARRPANSSSSRTAPAPAAIPAPRPWRNPNPTATPCCTRRRARSPSTRRCSAKDCRSTRPRTSRRSRCSRSRRSC